MKKQEHQKPENRGARRQRLSVCMIVKNEERFLHDCLQSIRAIADEIVIVDTGSSDKTIEIARAFGIIPYSCMWSGDFAAARNVSLSHCTGDWILYLDADERVSPESCEEILRVIGKPDVSAYYCLLRSEEKLPGGVVHSLASYPRLFRHRAEFHFTGRVHEQIESSILSSGHSICLSNIIIDHLGYAQSPEINRSKCERNATLLRLQLRDNPGDSYCRYQLGNTLAILGENVEAITELQKAISSPGISTQLRVSVLNCLAHISENSGRQDEGILYAGESLSLDSGQVTARWQLSTFHISKQDYQRALPLLKEIGAIQQNARRGERFDRSSDATIPEEALSERIAACLESVGNYGEAADWCFHILEENRNHANALEHFLACLERIDNFDRRVSQMELLIKAGCESPSLFCALARTYLQKGAFTQARTTLERCPKQTEQDGDVAALWIDYCLATSDSRKAHEVYERAIRYGVDSYRFHKAAVKHLLLRKDLSSALAHLQKMGKGLDGAAVPQSPLATPHAI